MTQMMKFTCRTMNIGLGILLILTVGIASSAVGSEGQGQLPPIVNKYQGQNNYEKTSNRKTEIYTKDDAATVTDFYRSSLKMDPVEEGKFLLGTDATYENKVGHTDESLWLTINSPRRGLKEADLFGFLHQEVVVKKKHSNRELEQVKQKYAHLANAWYPDFDAKNKLESCGGSARQNVTTTKNREPRRNKAQEKEMVAQIQQLIAQGRHQEAAALAQGSARPGMDTGRAMQQDQETDHWDKWLSCLDEVDEHDYQTKIEIDLYSRYFKPSASAEEKGSSSRKSVVGDVSKKVKGLKNMFKF